MEQAEMCKPGQTDNDDSFSKINFGNVQQNKNLQSTLPLIQITAVTTQSKYTSRQHAVNGHNSTMPKKFCVCILHWLHV